MKQQQLNKELFETRKNNSSELTHVKRDWIDTWGEAVDPLSKRTPRKSNDRKIIIVFPTLLMCICVSIKRETQGRRSG